MSVSRSVRVLLRLDLFSREVWAERMESILVDIRPEVAE